MNIENSFIAIRLNNQSSLSNEKDISTLFQLTMAKKRELSIEIGDKKCKSAQLTKKYDADCFKNHR